MIVHRKMKGDEQLLQNLLKQHPLASGMSFFFLETNIKLRVRSVQSKVHGYLSWDQASVNKQLSGLMSLVCLFYEIVDGVNK